MKFSKILTTAFVALGATIALSGCIRETFPKESTITQEQLESVAPDILAENLLKGISRGLLAPAYGGWEHTDFGVPSVGVYNDHAAQIICTNGWMLGNAPAYNRFYMSSWGKGYGANSWMPVHYWFSYYPQIKSCNDVILRLQNIEGTDSYIAIARTYRAFLYLDLARLFECLPAKAPNNGAYEDQQFKAKGLTVPIVDEVMVGDLKAEELAKNNPRASREEMFNFILEDLAFAEEVMSAEGFRPTNNTDPTLPVVYGLKARVYLWLGGFEDGLSGELPAGNDAYALAAEYARKAITAFGGAVMSEKEWTDPITGFNTKASSWMWTLFHSTDTVAGNLHNFVAHMAPEAEFGYCPYTQPGLGSQYFDRLGKNDFRRKLVVDPKGNYASFKPYTQMSEDEYKGLAPYTFFKFRPAQGHRTDYATAAAIAIPLMRCEEMYFIEMEAITHTQGADAGWALLDEFMRKNRDPKYVCATMDIVDEIIFQKSIEFWGEGHVMYDMKRLDMGVNCTSEAAVNYDAQRRFKSSGRLPWWSIPIPQSETDINQAIKDNNPDPSSSLTPGK
ncbi:MAG: RagB/SusD family nutrient uptake outer membrane protein [Alistipes sp.]|nr:RagB/SusD family nutrient uptake outer membrane protein [Alistipes sp.]